MKILLVDDSMIIRNILRQVLENQPGIEICGEASNGQKAVEMNMELEPDLIIMDIEMPVMNGLEATKKIMETKEAPIFVLSNAVDSFSAFDAIDSGALELMAKPDMDQFNDPRFVSEFMLKLQGLSRMGKARKARLKKGPAGPVEAEKKDIALVVMGASTGGPKAVHHILRELPAAFPVGIALVQHIENEFDKKYAQWLNDDSELTVRIAKDGNTPVPGEVLVAPVGTHLIFTQGVFRLDDGPKILNQKPSVDALFKTAAGSLKKRVLGVLLTGMGSDGADGCVEIKNHGGYTLVQDSETSTIFGMPKMAIEKGGASRILPLQDFPYYLKKLTGLD